MGGWDWCKKVKAHAVGVQYAVGVSAKRSTGTVELANMGGGDCYPLVQKGQTPHAVGMQYAVGTQYTVGVSAKRSHGWLGPLPFSAKRYAVGTQYAVCISAKRSTGTVELTNMGGGDRYPLVQKGQPPHRSGYAVHSGYAVCSKY